MEKKERVCPVCDAPLDEKAKKCSSCGADLSLFDVDIGEKELGVIESEGKKSLDDLLMSIGEGGEEKIFEKIKTIGKKEYVEEEKEVEVLRFECPNCGIELDEQATSCPNCGVEFVEEVVEQFECPLCNAVVDAHAISCPNCGVEFVEEVEEKIEVPVVEERVEMVDEKTLYQQLPKLVAEIKDLLLIAKKKGVDVPRSKELIQKAISAGRQRDIRNANRYIIESKKEVENALYQYTLDKVEQLKIEIDEGKQTKIDLTLAEDALGESRVMLENKKYGEAIKLVDECNKNLDELMGEYRQAKKTIDSVETVIKEIEGSNIDVGEAKRLFQESKSALESSDWSSSLMFARESRDKVMEKLPLWFSEEMKNAREILLDAKAAMKNITRPVSVLKKVSIALKKEDYSEALRYIKSFREMAKELT